MKQIERLKLNQLSKEELQKRELKQIKGGNLCKCCCGYAGEPGGSLTTSNMTANYNAGHTSSYGEEFCYCIDSIPWSGKFGDFGN
jgi:natural product precursor